MTQEIYDEICVLNKEYKNYSEAIYLMEEGLENLKYNKAGVINNIMNKCDHAYPDGKSALEGNFYNQCKICEAIV
jgi:hypothetical protein